jgi:hypothetical protein
MCRWLRSFREGEIVKRILNILFLEALFVLGVANPFCFAANSDFVEIHGTIFNAGQPKIIPVNLARVLFISSRDTISFIANYGDFHLRLPRALITSVSRETGSNPREFTLYQNYPNPFNPSTIVMYQLSAASEVGLTVYAITGQKVRLLDSGLKEPGNHSIVWDGRDEQGRRVGAGVYLYQLKAGARTETKKMLLLDGGGNFNKTNSPSIRPKLAEKNERASLTFDIVVLKDGYEPYRESGFNISDTVESIRKEILLTRTFTPGEYLPLSIGDKWEYLSAINADSRTFVDVPDSLISEKEVRVIDSRIIDGKEYALLNGWPFYIPEIFHNKDIPPLVRVSAEGDLILRYRDTDLSLYRFSQANKTNELDLGFIFRNSPQDSSRFQGKYIDTTVYSEEQPCDTPAGTYIDCRLVSCEEDNKGYWGSKYLLFSRAAGPVCCTEEVGGGREYTFLKRALLGEEQYGVLPGVCEADTVTDTDLLEILRLVLDPSRLPIKSVQSGYPYSHGDTIVGSDNERVLSLVPYIPNFKYAPFSRNHVQEIIQSGVTFSYFSLARLPGEPSGILFVDGKVCVPLAGEFVSEGEVHYNIGSDYEFSRKKGMWVGKEVGSWIAEGW